MVAVVTYRRPRQLAVLLDAVLPQVGDVQPPARVLVVDNDPQGGARAVTDARAGLGIDYVHEPRPGLAAVRNRALDAARGTGARVVVFVDDDEVPQPGWLAALVAMWERTGADAVAGPSRKVLPQPVDRWVQASGFFLPRPGRTHGAPVPAAASHNLLLDLDRLRDRGLRFDERFGLTGGEDTMLTLALTAAGGTILWCEDALVLDPVPRHRAQRGWVLAREHRTGCTWSTVHLSLARGLREGVSARAGLTALGAALVARGSLLALVGRVGGSDVRSARGDREVARGTGVVRGAWGGEVEEYARR
ncbi:glycosyltransferase family 2 protein [Cellulomonas sp. JZ18]|uniref:glycosyltransferase family 2 protein n=1 Tax=Cellulomonas sp. JZ18 TaxID=2654191 RepID=UPI0018AFC7A5|nr:glycosyltransferase [Cellulomonas sp. JZ18]